MTYKGPWEQPADITYISHSIINGTTAGVYNSDITVAEGSAAPDPATSWVHPSTGTGGWQLREDVLRVHSLGTTDWVRQTAFAAADLASLDLSSPGPTPAEIAQPHYVSWEAEGPVGTIHYPVTIDVDLTIGGLEYTDDIEHKDPLSPPDLMQGFAQLRRVPAAGYTMLFGSPILTPDVWPVGASWATFMQEALLQDKTVVALSGDSYTDNTLYAAGDNTFTLTATYTAADLDDGYRIPLLLTLSRWVAGAMLTEPDVTDPPATGHGFTAAHKGGTGGAFIVTAAARATFTFTPPRYRIIYDFAPPLRQYPRDDALGGAPRQGHANPPKSSQASTRQGWVNTYR